MQVCCVEQVIKLDVCWLFLGPAGCYLLCLEQALFPLFPALLEATYGSLRPAISPQQTHMHPQLRQRKNTCKSSLTPTKLRTRAEVTRTARADVLDVSAFLTMSTCPAAKELKRFWSIINQRRVLQHHRKRRFDFVSRVE